MAHALTQLSVHASNENEVQNLTERFAERDFNVPVSLVLDDRPGYALKMLSALERPLPVLLVAANRSMHYLLDLLEYKPQGLLVTSSLPPARVLAFYLSRVAIGDRPLKRARSPHENARCCGAQCTGRALTP